MDLIEEIKEKRYGVEKKVTVLKIHDELNGPELYRMDDKEGREHFFDNLENNFERGEKYTISVEAISAEEWEEACRFGDETA